MKRSYSKKLEGVQTNIKEEMKIGNKIKKKLTVMNVPDMKLNYINDDMFSKLSWLI